jgi:acetyl esterase/lipase
MRDPLISPVYGDFRNFPPTILMTGTRDMFLSDVARTHRKLRESDVVAELHVYEGLSHAGYLVSPDTPESLNMYSEIDAFIDRFLDQPQ